MMDEDNSIDEISRIEARLEELGTFPNFSP
jgi:hypothetical protein